MMSAKRRDFSADAGRGANAGASKTAESAKTANQVESNSARMRNLNQHEMSLSQKQDEPNSARVRNLIQDEKAKKRAIIPFTLAYARAALRARRFGSFRASGSPPEKKTKKKHFATCQREANMIHCRRQREVRASRDATKTTNETEQTMTYDELENRMTVEAGEAFVTWGDVGDDSDLVDYNEMASREADSIHDEAFGQSFGCYNDSIDRDGNNDTLWNNLWLDIQRMWKFPNDDERISVPAVIDGDDPDIYTTVRKLDEAVCNYARENVHLTDEQREQLVAQLRNDYPERIAKNNKENEK